MRFAVSPNHLRFAVLAKSAGAACGFGHFRCGLRFLMKFNLNQMKLTKMTDYPSPPLTSWTIVHQFGVDSRSREDLPWARPFWSVNLVCTLNIPCAAAPFHLDNCVHQEDAIACGVHTFVGLDLVLQNYSKIKSIWRVSECQNVKISSTVVK